MMKRLVDPFVELLPKLDLHGETKESAKFLINSFLKDNYLIGNEKVVIIHGRSTGILRKETQNILKLSKIVKNYSLDSNNDGQTIVELIKRT